MDCQKTSLVEVFLFLEESAIKFKKLDQSFYQENTHIKEALDNHCGSWTAGKTRGYGVVVIKINNLTFAIPLRSKIRHKSSYIVVKSKEQGLYGKGLDYSKSLLISKRSYILENEPFMIPAEERKRLSDKGSHIRKIFEKYVEKYVEKYIDAVKKGDPNVLDSEAYRDTTLQNYHSELGI